MAFTAASRRWHSGRAAAYGLPRNSWQWPCKPVKAHSKHVEIMIAVSVPAPE